MSEQTKRLVSRNILKVEMLKTLHKGTRPRTVYHNLQEKESNWLKLKLNDQLQNQVI